MYFKKYYFAPSWRFTFGAIFLCLLFIRLGFWQLHRASENEQFQTNFNARLHAKPIALTDLLKRLPLSASKAQSMLMNYYPIEIVGHYDNAHTILLDNKIHEHQVGYEVITPFFPDQTNTLLLINRGWIPANANNRQILPNIPPIDGRQTIIGNLYITPGNPFVFDNTLENSKNWPIRVQVLDFKQVEKILNTPVYPFIVWLSPNANDGFIRDWQPISISPEKNRGYALQWFSFAFVLTIIFFALNIKRH